MEKLYTLKQVAEIIGIKYTTLVKDWRQRLLPSGANYINISVNPEKECTPRFRQVDIETFIRARLGIQKKEESTRGRKQR